MSVPGQVLSYQVRNIVRGHVVTVYGLLLLVLTHALLRLGGGGPHALLSLMNTVLLFVPLVSLLFGTTYLYDARPFTELLLTQPVGRTPLFVGLWAGLTMPLVVAFTLGAGLPFLWHREAANLLKPLLLLLLTGTLLTASFTAVAAWIAVRFDDRAHGIAVALAVWAAAAIVYDAILLLAMAGLSEWPLEGPLIGISLLNPIDAARIGMTFALDAPVLLGYAGAVLQRAAGAGGGLLLALAALAFWSIVPALYALHRFRGKDF